MRYIWILSVIILGTPHAWAEDLNDDGCEDIQYAANGACISDSASLDPTVTTISGTFVGTGASVGPFVALDDVSISPRATLDGWVAHTTQPLPVGAGTVVGRSATLGADHILGPDTTISRAVIAGARLTTGNGVTVGYAAVLGTDVTVDADGTVGSLVELGNFTHVGTTAVIARGSTVADSDSSGAASTILGIVGPNVTIGADVLVEGTARVRKQATLLDGAQVLDGARVGRGAIVEAGATVSGVVRANATVCEGATLGATDLVTRGGTWPPTGCSIDIVDNAGVREWSDGTYADSCNDYLNPGAGHAYAGATGDGLYRVDPDQDGNNLRDVYCDQDLRGGGWTLVNVSIDATYGTEFNGIGGPCVQPTVDCALAVPEDIVDAATEVLFHTDGTYWAELNYTNGGKWALAMKDSPTRGTSAGLAGLTVNTMGSSVDGARAIYWDSMWDNSTGIIFSNGSHNGILGISYGPFNNGWNPNGGSDGDTADINIYIR